MFDILIRGGTVVTEAGVAKLDVAITGERITGLLAPGLDGLHVKTTIDADSLLVMPGGVDPHVHYSGPPTPAGGVAPETQDYSPAAAFGGVTTIIDFAFAQAPGSLHDAIAAKKAEATGRMAVDFGLHIGSLGNPSFALLEEIPDAIGAGLPTFKAYMIYDEWTMDDGHLWAVMTTLAENGGLCLVHAEDDAIAEWLTQKYLRDDKRHGGYIVETRSPLVEEAAIRRAQLLAARSGSPLYVVHVTSQSGVNAIAEARSRGLEVYGETTTPYLSFTQEKLWEGDRGLLWATTPPVKYPSDREALWQAIAGDQLQVVASDHFVVSIKDKYERMGTTVDSLMGGYEGVELRIPVLFDRGVLEGRLTLERFVELVSTNPAKIMGLYPRKGSLSPGADADIMIIDPEKTWTVRWEDLHTSAEYSPWEGWELRGKVVTTLLRGAILVQNGEFIGSRTSGRFVPRQLTKEIAGTQAGAERFVAT